MTDEKNTEKQGPTIEIQGNPFRSSIESAAVARMLARPGKSTTEFKGKIGVQALMVGVMLLKQIGVDVDISEETAILIIGGVEAAYALGRSIVKGMASRA